MDSFIGGVFLGIIIGVWLSAAFLFLVLPRQKPCTNSAPPEGQIPPAVSAPPKGQIPPAVADDETIDWPPRNKPKPVKEPPCHLSLDSVEVRELFHQLVVMAHGDRAQAERLVCHEKRLNPHAPERMLVDNAIYRWRRDNQ